MPGILHVSVIHGVVRLVTHLLGSTNMRDGFRRRASSSERRWIYRRHPSRPLSWGSFHQFLIALAGKSYLSSKVAWVNPIWRGGFTHILHQHQSKKYSDLNTQRTQIECDVSTPIPRRMGKIMPSTDAPLSPVRDGSYGATQITGSRMLIFGKPYRSWREAPPS